MKIYISLLLSILIILSCSGPDTFVLNDKFDLPINGRILTDLNSVEQEGDNSLLLHNNGTASLKVNNITQIHADFTVKILSGDGVRFAFRTVDNNYFSHPAIYFDLSTDGCFLKENNNTLLENRTIKANINNPARVQILNEGKCFTVILNCDTLYKGKTQLPTTEYVVVQAHPLSDVYLSGIQFADILEFEEYGLQKQQ